jgi:hypothetical protein
MLGHFDGLEDSPEALQKKQEQASRQAKAQRGSVVADDGRFSAAGASKRSGAVVAPSAPGSFHMKRAPSIASKPSQTTRAATSLPPPPRSVTAASDDGAGIGSQTRGRRSVSGAPRSIAASAAAATVGISNAGDDARSYRSGKSRRTARSGRTHRSRRRSSVVKARDKTVEAGRLLRAAFIRRARATRDVILGLGDTVVQSCLLDKRAALTAQYGRTMGRRRSSLKNLSSAKADASAIPLQGVQPPQSALAKSAAVSATDKDGGGVFSVARVEAGSVQYVRLKPVASLLHQPLPQSSIPAVRADEPLAPVATAPLAPLQYSASARQNSGSFEGSEDGDSHSRASLSCDLSSLHTNELSSRGRGTVGSDASTEHGSDSGSEDEEEDDEDEDIYAQWQKMIAEASDSTARRGSARSWIFKTAVAAGKLFLLTFCCCFVRDRAGAKKSGGKASNRACFILTERHPLRRLCIYLSGHPRFDSLVLFVIFASSVCLAISSPTLDPDGMLSNALSVLDVIWVVFFTIEMAIRLVALGVGPFGPGTYLRSGWNVLDGAIVAVSWLSFATEGNASFRSLRALRALRALRPLRVVRRLPGLRLVVHSLFRAFWPVLNVVLVCSILFLIFA